MPKKKEEDVVMEIGGKKPTDDLKNAMLEVGCKLCEDFMNGKCRDEKTALTAIVEIYEAVNGV